MSVRKTFLILRKVMENLELYFQTLKYLNQNQNYSFDKNNMSK